LRGVFPPLPLLPPDHFRSRDSLNRGRKALGGQRKKNGPLSTTSHCCRCTQVLHFVVNRMSRIQGYRNCYCQRHNCASVRNPIWRLPLPLKASFLCSHCGGKVRSSHSASLIHSLSRTCFCVSPHSNEPALIIPILIHLARHNLDHLLLFLTWTPLPVYGSIWMPSFSSEFP
jgi:hypothetical protein